MTTGAKPAEAQPINAERERIIRDWTPQGYLIEAAKVWVNA